MYVVVARFQAQEGKGDEVERALAEMIPHALAEPGCDAYYVNRSREDADLFLLYEQYRDEAAFQFHTTTEPFKRLVLGRAVPLLANRGREIYSLVEPVDPA